MDKIFIPIYHFFERYKWLMYALLIVSSIVFVWFGLQVNSRATEKHPGRIPAVRVMHQSDKMHVEGQRGGPDSPAPAGDKFHPTYRWAGSQ